MLPFRPQYEFPLDQILQAFILFAVDASPGFTRIDTAVIGRCWIREFAQSSISDRKSDRKAYAVVIVGWYNLKIAAFVCLIRFINFESYWI